MSSQDVDTWTPKLVRERLVEAIRWARYNAGPTGPAPVRALMPTYIPSQAERDEEGWGHPETADDDEPVLRRQLRPDQVSAIIDALHWPARYAVPELPTSARILNLWLRCKVYRGNFDKTIERQGEMSRASAYRMRDRALAAIAVGLERDGVPRP
ncbi:hypothetical protein [Microcystis phage Mae-JY30]